MPGGFVFTYDTCSYFPVEQFSLWITVVRCCRGLPSLPPSYVVTPANDTGMMNIGHRNRANWAGDAEDRPTDGRGYWTIVVLELQQDTKSVLLKS